MRAVMGQLRRVVRLQRLPQRAAWRARSAAVALVAGGGAAMSMSMAQASFEPDHLEESSSAASTIAGVPTVLTPKTAPIVLGNGKQDVFLMVFADWCHKCQGLKVVYAQVAEALKDIPIVVATVDGTKYRPPGFTAEQERGFPRLRMFPAGASMEPEEEMFYLENRLSATDIITFIHKHSTITFDLAAALARSDALTAATEDQLKAQIRASIVEDEQSNTQFKVTALGPCAGVMREVFLEWRLKEYQTPRAGDNETGMEGMTRVQKCLASKKNEDFWLKVTEVAMDQVRVSDNAQKKFGIEYPEDE